MKEFAARVRGINNSVQSRIANKFRRASGNNCRGRGICNSPVTRVKFYNAGPHYIYSGAAGVAYLSMRPGEQFIALGAGACRFIKRLLLSAIKMRRRCRRGCVPSLRFN